MADIADRFARVAGDFTRVAGGAEPQMWDDPTPCAGWVARDVVRHLVEWVPAMLGTFAGVDLVVDVAADDDPLAAWTQLRDGLQAVLDDPARAAGEFVHERVGSKRTDEAIADFVLGDVLIHTWDLARAFGLDVRLDPEEVRIVLLRTEPKADTLSASGHYAPAVGVPAGADEQDRLLGLVGRQP